MEVLLNKMHASTDATFRAQCLATLHKGLSGPFTRTAALSLSLVTGSWHVENQERKYTHVRARRNLENKCSDDIVNIFLKVVRENGIPLCKDFYRLKRRILEKTQNIATFRWSDRNAPVVLQPGVDESPTQFTWQETVSVVERGYESFCGEMKDMFQRLVKEQRIDVFARNGKKGGAYCTGVVPEVGPFILLNCTGTEQDIMTLAHESGHACHNMLAYQHGYLQFQPPLMLAETASIFGETIVFRDMLQHTHDTRKQLSMLVSHLDRIMNTVVRQCCFDLFEEKVHAARSQGELSVIQLDGLWMECIREFYGTEPSKQGDSPFDSYENAEHLWSIVSHFHEVPFYVHSYAFANLMVGALCNKWDTSTIHDFKDQYLKLLASGGTKTIEESFQEFGFFMTTPAFWNTALTTYIGSMLSRATCLANDLLGV
jgi:oligoendopeptidase F